MAVPLHGDRVALAFLCALGIIAICAITAGVYLATTGYSSAGAFSIAAACVGVLGTLAAKKFNGGRNVE